MKALAEETPKDFEPPKVWTPSADREIDATKPLAYNAPLNPVVAWGLSGLVVAIMIGAPILWKSNIWNTRPEVLEHASPVGKRADVAKQLKGKVHSPTQILVPLNSDRYEDLLLQYANATDEVPTRINLEVRHGKPADEAARDLLSSRLNGGLDNGNWQWGDVHFAWSAGGMSAEVGRDLLDPLRKRRALAAWSLILGAAFNPALSPSADELRDVMGGGYPVLTLSKISSSMPLERVKATVAAAFPGALIEAKIQMNATIPLDHPFLRSAELRWFVEPGGMMREASFVSKPALRSAALDAFARCLTRSFGQPRVTIVDPIEGTKSYTFRSGTAQIDLHPSLSMSAYGLHGVPTTVEAETWQKLVTALNACRG